jgi:nicotinamidase-related amidase
MALTTLDPNTALIVIDLQHGIVAMPTAHPTADVVKRAAALAEAFRHYKLPVVIVNVAGGAPGRSEQARPPRDFPPGFVDLVPELQPHAGDHRITKHTWGAFTNTGLNALINKLGVTQVVIAGVATSAGVESTGRHAHENGFNVTFAIDAMTDLNAEAHANSIARIFPRIGETGTTREIIDLLASTHS